MKKLILGCFAALGMLCTIESCSEKELLMPESVSSENPPDNTRPPLRPDSVSVYADFYHTLEVVFPVEQPDRVVKAVIEWDKTSDTWEKIEVTNFNAIVRLENLELREYTFKVTYFTTENLASKTVTLKQTPLEELYKYVENVKLEGKDGLIVVDWKNETGREVRIDVRHTVDGQEQIASKLSDKVLDTLIIENLDKGLSDFHISVFDPVREFGSGEMTITADPGEAMSAVVLRTLRIASFAPARYAGVVFENQSDVIPVTVKIVYQKDDDTPVTRLYENVLNQKIVELLADVKIGSSMEITVTDSRVSRSKTEVISSTGITDTEFDRTGWTAAASSARGGETQIAQLLDGIYGAGSNNGWVNQWGASANDLTGTASNVFPHFVQVDMKEPKFVTGFRTINHSNGTQEGARQFTLQYSLDGETFIDAQDFERGSFLNHGYGPKSGPNASLSYTLDVPVLTRYVRYWAHNSDHGTGNMRMAEFYVSGVD